MNRVRFDLTDGEPFNVELNGQRFGYTDCYEYAVIADLPAGIYSSVFKSRDGLFAKVTIIADDDGDTHPGGIAHGWYSARLVSEEDARLIRDSWNILRSQPALPGGPWA